MLQRDPQPPSVAPLKHKRYPRSLNPKEQAMTIAAGFSCRDGILLCADSQYTGAEKQQRSKLVFRAAGDVFLAFAISGDPDFCRSAIDDACEGIQVIPRDRQDVWATRKAIRRAISRSIDDYRKSGLEDGQRPQLLIAMAGPRFPPWLFSTWQSAMPQVTDYQFLGSGSYIAHYIMQAFSPDVSSLTIENMIPIATYAMSAAKRHDAYCGGGSQYVAMHGAPMPGSQECFMSGVFSHQQSDQQFVEYERWCGGLLSSICDSSLDAKGFDERLASFMAVIGEIRGKLMASGSDYQGIVQALGIQKRE
jgi:20S proteasome alpha/beta subunit